MSIDLSQFHQVFFEESFEGLDVMEASLMELQPDNVDSETINTIFRSAHSIKGGSATFGFSKIAEFTHVLETLLDEIRDGRRGIDQDDIDLYLQSVDCMRDQLGALQDGTKYDEKISLALQREFEKILSDGSNTDSTSSTTLASVASDTLDASNGDNSSNSEIKLWDIYFSPGSELLKTGNDPLRILRDLADLGTLKIEILLINVPKFNLLDPESCHLSWNLTLESSCSKADIDEIFEWVVDESELTIQTSECNKISLYSTASKSLEKTSFRKACEYKKWNIHFKPGVDIMRTGNEPIRMFRELADLPGVDSVRTIIDVSEIPVFSKINPESCYCAWEISLVVRENNDISEARISEIFEWVADESDIQITAGTKDISSPQEDKDVNVPVNTPDEDQLQAAAAESKIEKKNNQVKKLPIKQSPAKEASSIRVGIDKVDSLINMVGELVITQSMLGQLGNDFDIDQLPRLIEGLGQLEHNTRELQESVMRIRMLPISFAFSRFPRMVRDLCRRLDKKIDLQLIGETTELDKTVMEKIGDPLVHLVRNSIDHGIEMPAYRETAGKNPTGKIILNAYHQGGSIVIEISDDGKGMSRDKIVTKAIEKNLISERDGNQYSDAQVYDLIFQPGFSTADEVSDVSGRGVGMDVVRRNIQDLNGTVELESKADVGSTVTIRLPLTLAILDGQLIKVGQQTYIFSLVSIIESMQITAEKISQVAGGCDVFQLRNEYIPIVRLFEIFDIEPSSHRIEESLLVVVESEGEKVGIVVDDLEAQQQVVIKSLEANYQRIEGVSGATILGDGTVALILDVPGLVKIAGIKHQLAHQGVLMDQSRKAEVLALG